MNQDAGASPRINLVAFLGAENSSASQRIKGRDVTVGGGDRAVILVSPKATLLNIFKSFTIQ